MIKSNTANAANNEIKCGYDGYFSGKGTEKDPYKIETAQQLACLTMIQFTTDSIQRSVMQLEMDKNKPDARETDRKSIEGRIILISKKLDPLMNKFIFGKYYEIVNDINLANLCGTNDNVKDLVWKTPEVFNKIKSYPAKYEIIQHSHTVKGWIPIGVLFQEANRDKSFILNGNGHTISNVQFDKNLFEDFMRSCDENCQKDNFIVDITKMANYDLSSEIVFINPKAVKSYDSSGDFGLKIIQRAFNTPPAENSKSIIVSLNAPETIGITSEVETTKVNIDTKLSSSNEFALIHQALANNPLLHGFGESDVVTITVDTNSEKGYKLYIRGNACPSSEENTIAAMCSDDEKNHILGSGFESLKTDEMIEKSWFGYRALIGSLKITDLTERLLVDNNATAEGFGDTDATTGQQFAGISTENAIVMGTRDKSSQKLDEEVGVSKPVSSAKTFIRFGAQITSNLPQGNYKNTVVMTALPTVE